MNKKYWHVFYVSSYKGGELCSIINKSIEEILGFIVSDFIIYEEFDSIENIGELTDEDLYDIYWGNVSNNEYAFDGTSAPQVYYTAESGKLIKSFPPKATIVEYMRKILREYKENSC